MNFKEFLLNEMHIHKLSSEADVFVAFRGHLWLLQERQSNIDAEVTKIYKAIRAEHPAGKKLKKMEKTGWYDLVEWVRSYIPDALIGDWDGETKVMTISMELGTNPITSPLVKKVMEALKAKKVYYNTNYNFEKENKNKGYYGYGTDHSDRDEGDRDVFYTRKQAIGTIPNLMYHGTNTNHLPSILKFGLRPDMGNNNWPNIDITHDDRVFLAARFEDAEFHAAHSSYKERNGYPVVLQFEIPDRAQIQPDFDVDTVSFLPKGTKSTYLHTNNSHKDTKASISADKLTKHAGMIGYTGRIPASFIRAVYLRINKQWKKVRIDTLRKRILDLGDYEWLYRYGIGF